MGANDVFLARVVPILGGVVAIVMYVSPLRAAYAASRQRSLGELNPIPFAVTFCSTACWCAYGFAAPDVYMFLPNVPGLTAALYTAIIGISLAPPRTQAIMLAIMCAATPLVLGLAVLTAFVLTHARGKALWGVACNVVTIGYYAAPLSTALQVVRTRSSASIYLPTCICNLVNAALWVAYGAAVQDGYVWVPNAVGGACAVLLISLCLTFPNHKAAASSSSASLPRSKGSGGDVNLLLDPEQQSQHEPGSSDSGLIRSYTPEPQAQPGPAPASCSML